MELRSRRTPVFSGSCLHSCMQCCSARSYSHAWYSRWASSASPTTHSRHARTHTLGTHGGPAVRALQHTAVTLALTRTVLTVGQLCQPYNTQPSRSYSHAWYSRWANSASPTTHSRHARTHTHSTHGGPALPALQHTAVTLVLTRTVLTVGQLCQPNTQPPRSYSHARYSRWASSASPTTHSRHARTHTHSTHGGPAVRALQHSRHARTHTLGTHGGPTLPALQHTAVTLVLTRTVLTVGQLCEPYNTQPSRSHSHARCSRWASCASPTTHNRHARTHTHSTHGGPAVRALQHTAVTLALTRTVLTVGQLCQPYKHSHHAALQHSRHARTHTHGTHGGPALPALQHTAVTLVLTCTVLMVGQLCQPYNTQPSRSHSHARYSRWASSASPTTHSRHARTHTRGTHGGPALPALQHTAITLVLTRLVLTVGQLCQPYNTQPPRSYSHARYSRWASSASPTTHSRHARTRTHGTHGGPALPALQHTAVTLVLTRTVLTVGQLCQPYKPQAITRTHTHSTHGGPALPALQYTAVTLVLTRTILTVGQPYISLSYSHATVGHDEPALLALQLVKNSQWCFRFLALIL